MSNKTLSVTYWHTGKRMIEIFRIVEFNNVFHGQTIVATLSQQLNYAMCIECFYEQFTKQEIVTTLSAQLDRLDGKVIKNA